MVLDSHKNQPSELPLRKNLTKPERVVISPEQDFIRPERGRFGSEQEGVLLSSTLPSSAGANKEPVDISPSTIGYRGRVLQWPQMARPHHGVMPPTSGSHRHRKHAPRLRSSRFNQTAYRMALDHWDGSGLSLRAETVLRRLIARSSASLDKDVVLSLPRLAMACARGPALAWGEGPATMRRVVRELIEFGAVSVADVDYAPKGVELRVSATEVQRRRPKVNSYRLQVPEVLRERFEQALAMLEARRESRRTTPSRRSSSSASVRAAEESTVAAQQALMARQRQRRGPVERAKPSTVAAAVEKARSGLGRHRSRAGPSSSGTGD